MTTWSSAGWRGRVAALRLHVAGLHSGGSSIDDAGLDRRIGLCPERCEPVEPLADLLLAYGNHRIERGDLPYEVIRELFRRLPPGGTGPLVDLGCGYGRIAFYGALLRNGFGFWGIELIRQRVAEACRVRDALGLSALHFIQGDATGADWPESDRYCLMNPDLLVHAPALIRRLESEARRRPIVVASVSSTNLLLAEEPWLEELGPPAGSRLGLRFFASRRAGAPG